MKFVMQRKCQYKESTEYEKKKSSSSYNNCSLRNYVW